jgi:hypothetical protein
VSGDPVGFAQPLATLAGGPSSMHGLPVFRGFQPFLLLYCPVN